MFFFFSLSSQQSGELKVGPVYSSSASGNPHPVNASLLFLTDQLSIFSNGRDSLVLLATSDRTKAFNQPPNWTVVAEVTPQLLRDVPFVVECAHLDSSGLSLDMGLLQLKDTMTVTHPVSSTAKPTVCVFQWYRVNFSCSLLSLDEGEKADVSSANLCCSFESTTMPLHADFMGGNLLVVSESSLKQPSLQDSSEVEEERGKEGDKEDGEGEVDEGAGSSNHPGMGYKEATQHYEWTQTESDVTVNVCVPFDVTKQDVSCVIEPDNLVVGLTDGTTFARGKLFANIDCAGSVWTLEKNR